MGKGRMIKMNRYTKMVLSSVLMLAGYCSYAQTPTDSLPADPGAISLSTYQNMHFGSFTQGAGGGSILLSNTGIRSSSGTVTLLNLGILYYQAIFEIEAPQNSLLSITTETSTTLSGSNGGTMTLNLGSPSIASPFLTTIPPPGRTQLRIGGTLSVGNVISSPPGTYTGSFYITINNE